MSVEKYRGKHDARSDGAGGRRDSGVPICAHSRTSLSSTLGDILGGTLDAVRGSAAGARREGAGGGDPNALVVKHTPAMRAKQRSAVSALILPLTFHANPPHNLTRSSPSLLLT